MKKTIAIIGASYLQKPLVLKAKELGLRTICFAWDKDAVCKSLVDMFYPISIIEKDDILAKCKTEDIDGICTIASDVAAPTVAYVANKLDLVGNDYQAAVKANNKWLMREAFKSAGIPCPWFKCVSSYDDLRDENHIFPLIVKPVDRSGSMGVFKVNTDLELEIAIKEAVSDSFSKKAMVEQYVDGREISVEFISFENNHYPLTITDKVTTESPHFVELEHHQPSTLPNSVKNDINQITIKALNALGVTNVASHTEYKITDSGQIYIIELGARMGGDFIGSDLVWYSTGYDYLKGVIDIALNQFEVPHISVSVFAGIYFLSKETEKIKPIIENAKKYPEIVCAEITDATLRNITCSADRSGYFIYKGNKKFEII